MGSRMTVIGGSLGRRGTEQKGRKGLVHMDNSVAIAGGETVMEKYNFKNDGMVQAKCECEKCVRILKLLPWAVETLQ